MAPSNLPPSAAGAEVLLARIAELERELVARDKTIGVLVARVEGAHQNQGTAFTLFEQNVMLEGLVAERTRQLHEQGIQLERALTLRKANQALERACRAKDEFLAVVTHELRTPLNAILGFAESLDEEIYGVLRAEQRAAIRSIDKSGRRLLSLVEEILDLSAIEAGTLELELAPLDLEEVCRASVRSVREAMEKKHIALVLQLPEAPTRVIADARRLERILVHLLTNAIKFTPEGGRMGLEAAVDHVTETLRLTVWDTGIGIAQHHRGGLFRPFVQLDSKLSRRYEGAGLGLAVARGLARLHGGDISVESMVGAGSRFTMTLPHPGVPRGPD